MSASDVDGHSNMITAMPGQIDPDHQTTMQSLMYTSDFIGKNKNMLAFYREHDQEKR